MIPDCFFFPCLLADLTESCCLAIYYFGYQVSCGACNSPMGDFLEFLFYQSGILAFIKYSGERRGVCSKRMKGEGNGGEKGVR